MSGRVYTGPDRRMLGLIFVANDDVSCDGCLCQLRVGDWLFGVPRREDSEQGITGLTVCCLDCAPALALRSGLVLVRRDPTDADRYPLGEWETEQRRRPLKAG